jgi:hypothetical protein
MAVAAAHKDTVAAVDQVLQERRASGAFASTSSRSAGGSYRAYGSRLTLREDRRQPGWLYLDEESYLPQGLAQVGRNDSWASGCCSNSSGSGIRM